MRRNKLFFGFLIALLLAVLGGFAHFYKSIPKESLERLIGKSDSVKNRIYQPTPPSIDQGSRDSILEKMKAGLTSKEYIAEIEAAYINILEENENLRKENQNFHN